MKKFIGLGKRSINGEQQAALNAIASGHGYEIIDLSSGGEAELALIPECVALMGIFTQDQLRSATKLKWLQVPSAGVETFLPDELYQNPDAVLTNGSGAYGISISEYMICGLLMIQRCMIPYMENKQRREWKQFTGITTVYGSNVTVIGVGDIGSNFGRRMAQLGARVSGVRRSNIAELPDGFERMYGQDSIDDALRDADIVALCLPNTELTKHIIDRARLAIMKQNAIIINVGRGSAIDQDALIDALKSGKLLGAVLDVFTPEPLPPENELWSLPNVVLTPHVSGLDRDLLASMIVFDIFRDNLERFIAGQPLNNVVDRKKGY